MLTLRSVQQAARLTSWTIQAWIGLAAFDLVRAAGFAYLHQRLRTYGVRQPRGTDVGEVVWAVEEACVWYVKRAACLQRSFVTAWLLRQCGVSAELVIGCRPIPFESHAWVEVGGRVVNDRAQYQKAFTVLDRL